MASQEELARRADIIRRGLSGSGIDVRAESAGWSRIQGILSRGDSGMSRVLAGLPKNSLAAWRKTLAENDVDADLYLQNKFPIDEPLPWSVVDSGVSPDYLRAELEKARGAEETQPCPAQNCHQCGVC